MKASTLAAALLALLVVAAPAAPRAAPPAAKHILVLYDEDKDNFPGLASIDRSLRESFEAVLGNAANIHSESMGLSQFDRPGYEALVADFYRQKYSDRKPDLVIAVLEPSLDFLLRHADRAFPGVPIVFAGVDATAIAGKPLPATVTGALVKRAFSGTLEAALRLQPDAQKVVVVGGASKFDRFVQALARRDLQAFEGRIGIEYLFGLPIDEVLGRVASLPPNSVILYLTMLSDGAGRPLIPHEVLASISTAAKAPVYVFVDQFVGLGAVGGNVYSFATHGADVAKLGLKILQGAAPSSLSIGAPAAQVDLFDARQLKRWGLDEARLPPGSVVRFREPSVWDLYRWYVVAVALVLVTQAALIGGLLAARARQRRAEAETLRQRDELAHVLRVTTLSELTSEMAHEVSQPLTSIMLNANAVTRLLASGPGHQREVEEALADIAGGAKHAASVLERLRTLFRKERVEKGAVDVRALVEDVVRLLHAPMLIERIDLRTAFAGDIPAVFGDPVQLEQVLLNLVRNASDAMSALPDGPRLITITARMGPPGRVLVEVSDTGCGVKDLDLEHIFEHFVSTKPDGLGMGLAISRSIVSDHGGRIWASANPDRGLTLHVELLAWPGDAAQADQAGRPSRILKTPSSGGSSNAS